MEKNFINETELENNFPTINDTNNESVIKKQTINEEDSCIVSDSIFNEGQVYSLIDYMDKITIGVIESNRKEEKQITDKLKSCEENGMLVPGILVDSNLARAVGYSVKPVNEITSDHDKKQELTIMEGNSRFWAFMRALAKAKKDPTYTAFDYKFIYKKFKNPKQFKDSYRQINIANVPTKTKDFVRDLLATDENQILSSYNEKIDSGLSAKASGYATVNQEIMKRDINAAMRENIAEYLTDCDILEFTTPVYYAVLKAFGCESGKVKPILKGSAIWKFNANKFNSFKDKNIASDRLVKFYENLSSATTSNVISAKKTTKKSKEQVIIELMEKEYKKQNASL